MREVRGAAGGSPGLRGISAAFAAARVHVIRGDGESGKNALFRYAGLLEKPEEGEVFLFGSSACELRDEARADLRTQRVGFVFSAPFLLNSFSVIENVAMPLFKVSHVDSDEARRRTEAMLEFVELAGFAEAKAEELPLAAQFRVAVARGLVNEPAVLMVENLDGALAGFELDVYCDLLRRAAATYGVALVATATPAFRPTSGDRILDLCEGEIARDWECAGEAGS